MRTIVVTRTQVWETTIPDIADLEAEVYKLLHTDPDYETEPEVEER